MKSTDTYTPKPVPVRYGSSYIYKTCPNCHHTKMVDLRTGICDVCEPCTRLLISNPR